MHRIWELVMRFHSNSLWNESFYVLIFAQYSLGNNSIRNRKRRLDKRRLYKFFIPIQVGKPRLEMGRVLLHLQMVLTYYAIVFLAATTFFAYFIKMISLHMPQMSVKLQLTMFRFTGYVWCLFFCVSMHNYKLCNSLW